MQGWLFFALCTIGYQIKDALAKDRGTDSKNHHGPLATLRPLGFWDNKPGALGPGFGPRHPNPPRGGITFPFHRSKK